MSAEINVVIIPIAKEEAIVTQPLRNLPKVTWPKQSKEAIILTGHSGL